MVNVEKSSMIFFDLHNIAKNDIILQKKMNHLVEFSVYLSQNIYFFIHCNSLRKNC